MAIKQVLVALVTVGVVAASLQAQTEVGTVAATIGKLQVQRGATWQDVGVGVPVFAGDRLRTGDADQAKIVMRDDSVLDLAAKTELSLNKQTFDPATHKFESLLSLAQGKIRARVSDYYREPRARYQVETPTAIAGVRGTEFITVYDATAEVTEVVGIGDTVEVAGKLAVIGSAVQIVPQFVTRVPKGRFPTAPQRLDDAVFEQYLQGLDIIGTGRRDGLSVQHPATAGRLLAAQDLPTAATEGPKHAEAAAGLTVGAPAQSLADRLSPDVHTDTQPLLDYRSTPPGRVPAGRVHVGF